MIDDDVDEIFADFSISVMNLASNSWLTFLRHFSLLSVGVHIWLIILSVICFPFFLHLRAYSLINS